jgi:hypothetical protein
MEFKIDNTKVVTSFADNCGINNIIKLLVENNEDQYGHYTLEPVPDDEVECYSWDEADREVVDMMTPDSELYILKNGIGDFDQPLGVVLLIEED